ncbi:MlaA family lipoprotein [Novosphingobium sp.]|uniref:MlaA family lipoprotein n=1 Tax=Novosphingobium sp. TaxID=1874826 RepID=UPI003BACF884
MPASLIIPALLASSPVSLPPTDSAALLQAVPAAERPAAFAASPEPIAADASPAAAPADQPKTDVAAPAPTARKAHHHVRGDSLEGFNRVMFGTWQVLDKAAYRPAAMAYKHVVPRPLRSGIRHILSNLTEPLVFLNFILQAKPRSASKTLARFVINSTVGVGGAFDVAGQRKINLPHRDNGFGTTLALYGVGPGPYIFLPFVGPSNLRDLLGGASEGLVIPLTVGKPFNSLAYQIGTGAVSGLDRRAESDQELRALLSGSVDPYATLRSAWQQNRVGQIEAIRSGDKAEPAPEGQGELDDPMADPAQSGSKKPEASPPPPELNDPLADPAAPPSTP